MRRSSIGAGAAALAAGLCASAAGAAELRLYPVPGLYGLERTACAPAVAPGPETARIAEAFCPQFAQTQRQALGRHFQAQVKALLPGVADDLGAVAGEGETAEARLSKSLIASLHLSRADLWRVEKPGAVDTYVPLTLSLYLTNALTGEVLFLENYTTIVTGRLSKDSYLAQAQAQLPEHLHKAVSQLVANAAARFKPYPVIGKVRAALGERYVVDIGRRGGVREGDTLGADARVVFADAGYAIVEPMLGELKVGAELSRQVTQPVEALEKPSALIVVAGVPDGGSIGSIRAAFEDALGSRSGFTVMPVNPSFAELRRLALGEAQVSSAYADERAPPDYFVRLTVETLEPVEMATSVAGVTRKTYEAWAFVEVIDQGGRVVFATQANDRIVDDAVGDMAFAPEQRQDTAVRNALAKAAAALGSGFKPTRLRLEAKPAGEDIEIADAGGALATGARLQLLRRHTVRGVEGPVWAPVGAVEVVSADGATVRARSAEPFPLKARAGDQVAADAGAAPSASRRRFAACVTPDGRLLADRRGGMEQPLFAAVAVNAFAAGFAGPVHIAGFDQEVAPLLSQFAAAGRLPALQPLVADVCFQPVQQLDAQGEKPGRGGWVQPVYGLTVGYRLMQSGARIDGAGLQETLTATGVPADADAGQRSRALQLDLAGRARELSVQAARRLKPPQ